MITYTGAGYDQSRCLLDPRTHDCMLNTYLASSLLLVSINWPLNQPCCISQPTQLGRDMFTTPWESERVAYDFTCRIYTGSLLTVTDSHVVT